VDTGTLPSATADDAKVTAQRGRSAKDHVSFSELSQYGINTTKKVITIMCRQERPAGTSG